MLRLFNHVICLTKFVYTTVISLFLEHPVLSAPDYVYIPMMSIEISHQQNHYISHITPPGKQTSHG